MIDQPTLSIIIPVLNEATGLAHRLAALQVLRRRECELIVVDGGSDDGSAAIATPLVDRFIEGPRGRARQMNAGARLARANTFLFLHIDTEFDETALAALLEARKRADWGWFDVQLSSRQWPYRLIEFGMNHRARITRVCTGDQCLFVSKALFIEAGEFPDVPLMEDIALSKSLRRLQYPVSPLAKVTTSSRRWEKHGVVRTVLLMWQLRLLYFLGVAPESLVERYYPMHARANANANGDE